MNKGLGYLKTNGYKADIEDRYARQCADEGRCSIVVRFRLGAADIEWEAMALNQYKALKSENYETVKMWFRAFHEKYSTQFIPIDHYSVITGNGKIFRIRPETACKAASELNVFLLSMQQQYERKVFCHEE
jgi:hypothetical protein